MAKAEEVGIGERKGVPAGDHGDEGAGVGGWPGGGELLRGVRGAREPQEEREEHLLPRLLHQHLPALRPRAPPPSPPPGWLLLISLTHN